MTAEGTHFLKIEYVLILLEYHSDGSGRSMREARIANDEIDK